jgi:protein-disulfide isomerase
MSDEHQHHTVKHTSKAGLANALGIPFAIVIAGAIIAGAIVFTGMQKPTALPSLAGKPTAQQQETPEINVAEVTKEDHIKGNPKAPIMIVEYSDYDCPFCKVFHETMNQIMTEYGADGKVAWVYRHFPLAQLHPNATKIAEASECVADLGGNEAFWKFSDLVFGERAGNNPTDMTKLPTFATQAGVDVNKYNTCVSAGTFTKKIADGLATASAAGAQGTPYSVVLVGDEKIVINGAEPIAMVKQKIETALAQ